MTTGEALNYVLKKIQPLGYNDLSFEETYEIYDRLNRMEETTIETVDQMIEEVF